MKTSQLAHAAPLSITLQDDDHDHDQGLAFDLERLQQQAQSRRGALRRLAVGAMLPLPLIGCGGGSDSSSSDSSSSSSGSTTTTTATGSTSTTTTTGSTTTTTTDTTSTGSTGTTTTDTSTTSSTCTTIPEETAGPYPADGSNTNSGGVVNALTLSGFVRSDIRTSVGSASGTATGVPLTVKLELVNTGASCAALSGYAIYLWHCTAGGLSSLYSTAILTENYLRGVQATDSSGIATFTTIFPGCYSGRVPHIHLEVYPSIARATSSSNKIKTTQMAFPTDVCSAVYATSGYSSSASNLAQISFATDNVFSDGVTLQLATVTGSVSAGYVATLQVGIAA
jgi:protocatechuate 3,4-dioxygenase beta subunit